MAAEVNECIGEAAVAVVQVVQGGPTGSLVMPTNCISLVCKPIAAKAELDVAMSVVSSPVVAVYAARAHARVCLLEGPFPAVRAAE